MRFFLFRLIGPVARPAFFVLAQGRWRTGLASLLSCLAAAPLSHAQELEEPRRWAHLPVDANFLGGGYAFTKGDITLDPVLRIEDARMESRALALRYIRSFGLLGRSGRVDIDLGYETGRWSGLLDGQAASTSRTGPMDSIVRVALMLYGAPPLKGSEYAAYRAAHRDETIVGAALAVALPTGEYLEDRLINLGSNRYTIRPQFGVTHSHDRWMIEGTASASFFTANDSFVNMRLEQDPLYGVQGHLTYTFRPGLWAGASAGYGRGARSTINGIAMNDRRENVLWALSVGYPLSQRLGVKISYLGLRSLRRVGTESDTIVGSVSIGW